MYPLPKGDHKMEKLFNMYTIKYQGFRLVSR